MPPEPTVSLCPSCQAQVAQGTEFCGRCGYHVGLDLGAVAEQLNSPDGHALCVGGRYRLKRNLGCAHPRFYLFEAADERAGDKPVCLKILPLTDPERDAEAMQILEREGARRFDVSHPRIRWVGSVGQDGCLIFLVLEFIPGGNLIDWVAAQPGGHATPEQAIGLVADVAEGLQSAHDAGVVHRDVKPTNVLWYAEADGRVRAKVADFETIVLTGPDGKVDAARLFGSAPYMAPEQLEGKPAGPAADVYSLACVTYYLLAGRAPYPVYGSEWKAKEVLDPGTYPIPEGIPQAIYAVLQRGFHKDPARRPAKIMDLVEDLKRAAGLATAGKGKVLADEDEDDDGGGTRISTVTAALGGLILLAAGLAAGLKLAVPLGFAGAKGPAQNLLAYALQSPAPKVSIDGKPQGTSPALVAVAPGEHKVEIHGEGGKTFTKSVHVTPGAITVAGVDVPAAAPAAQGLVVASADSTWELSVDGNPTGSNPSFTPTEPGDHKVSATGKGAPTGTQVVRVAPGRVEPVMLGQGGPTGAYLVIWCPDPQAHVVLDDQESVLGETLGFYAVNPGDHTVIVQSGGRAGPPRTLTLKKGQVASIHMFTPPPPPPPPAEGGQTAAGWGGLQVTLALKPEGTRTAIEDLRLVLDGYVLVSNPATSDSLEARCLAGAHHLRVEGPGMSAYEGGVTIAQGEETRLTVPLTSLTAGDSAVLAPESVENTPWGEKYHVYRRTKSPDAARVVYIPPGTATVGDGAADTRGILDQETSGFYAYRSPVSEAQWNQFVTQSRQGQGSAAGNSADQTYFGLSAQDAAAYCRWAQAQTPTEAMLCRALAPPPTASGPGGGGDWFVARFGPRVPVTSESGEWCQEGPRIRRCGPVGEMKRVCLRPLVPVPVMP